MNWLRFLQFGSMAALPLGFNYARMRAFVEALRGNYLILWFSG